MKNAAFSSYPYQNTPGQPGQPGQTPENLANRASCKFYLNICTGTQPGQAGTLRYQDVSGRAKGRARVLPEPTPSGRRDDEMKG
jgi:hypothetical protein